MNTTPASNSTPLEFPLVYPLKAAGRNTPALEATVIEIVRTHVPELDATTVTVRESKGGKYLAVTVTFTATSREQLDALYRDLTAHPDILWAL
jgi:putative lipoic acid-binding regulatory protein